MDCSPALPTVASVCAEAMDGVFFTGRPRPRADVQEGPLRSRTQCTLSVVPCLASRGFCRTVPCPATLATILPAPESMLRLNSTCFDAQCPRARTSTGRAKAAAITQPAMPQAWLRKVTGLAPRGA